MKRPLFLILSAFAMLAATGCVPTWMGLASSTYAVPASIDPTGATDVSDQLSAFIRSVPDSSTIRFPEGARYRVEETLVIANRHQLWLDGTGATIFATTPGDRVRSNIQVVDSSAIVLSGLTIIGANPEAGLSDGAQVLAKEGQQGVDVRSVTGFYMIGVTITDTYGDFVYIGKHYKNPFSQNVLLYGNTFARNGRHGVTITAADNVLIQDNTIDDVRFATVDLEAHHPGFGMSNITVRNNHIGAGRGLLVASVGTGDRDNFTFEGNDVGRTLDIRMSAEDGATQRNWRILDNTSTSEAGNAMLAAMSFDHLDGLTVTGNYQQFETARPMVGARVEDSCNVVAGPNSFPGAVSEAVVNGSC